jgi:branched-chain amino acid transport system permease protein
MTRAWLKSPPLWAYAAVLVFLLLVPSLFPDYSVSLVEKVLIFALFAVSLDLIYGYAGLPSLGHAAYFGVGGYAAAVLMLKAEITSLWIVMPAGILVGTIVAAVFGVIALRSVGITFLLVTFALGQLLSTVAIEWDFLHSFGIEGLVGVAFPDLGFGFVWDPESIYYAVLIAVVIGYVIAMRVTRSPLGYAALGIREDEKRMRVFGFNTWWAKYKLFVISGALAALAGELFAFTSGTVLPTNLDLTYSALAFLIVVLAGPGTLYGPAIGAAVVVLLEYYVSAEIPDRWPLVLGLLFVLTAAFSRNGLVGGAKRLSAYARTRFVAARSRSAGSAP